MILMYYEISDLIYHVMFEINNLSYRNKNTIHIFKKKVSLFQTQRLNFLQGYQFETNLDNNEHCEISGSQIINWLKYI